MSRSGPLLPFAAVVCLVLVLYLPLFSRNYDPNGLNEAAALETGRTSDLFVHNHLLYRPAGYLLWQTLRKTGLVETGTVPVLQVLSAIFAALGVGFAYLAFERLTTRRAIAFASSLLLGVSWSYWTLGTDVYYFSMAAMFVSAAFALLARAESVRSFAACGLLAGLSILACQANVFLLPGLAVVLGCMSVGLPRRELIRRVAVLWGSAGVLVGASFTAVGVWEFGQRTPAALVTWASGYAGNALPGWGAWSPARVALALGSAFRSVVGLDFMMFGDSLLPGRAMLRLGYARMPDWIGMAGFVILAAGLAALFFLGAESASRSRMAKGLLAAYLVYLPFIVWWEASEPRWFILPNVFLGGFVAVSVAGWPRRRRPTLVMGLACLVLAGLNFGSSVRPKRFLVSYPARTADCVADHMGAGDLFLATEWNWARYLPSVHGRDMLSFIEVTAETGDKGTAMSVINDAVGERQRRAMAVYMNDIRGYELVHLEWLQSLTGLTADDLVAYTGVPAFDCNGMTFNRLNPLPDSTVR